MAEIIERRTKTILGKVEYLYNKPVSTSDLNESQSILLENSVRSQVGSIKPDTLLISVKSYESSSSGIIIKSFRYVCRDSDDNYFHGSIDHDVALGLNGPSSSDDYELYAYFRSKRIDHQSEVYLNGIRSNASQYGLSESTTPNNIFDDQLGEEVSVRSALELTFYLKKSEESSAPNLGDGWSAPVLVANVNLGSGTLINTYSDLESRINDLYDSKSDKGHTHTPSEVGLGSVKNYGVATKAEAEAGTSNSKYMTPLRTKNLVDKFVPSIKVSKAVDADTVNGKTVKSNVPENAKFTDTIYTLPTASSSVLGGIKVGSRLSISDGELSADIQSDNNFTNTLKSKLDGIESGANKYSLPTASSSTLGGIKIGSGLSISSSGVLSADSQLQLGTTSSTAYRGDRGKLAYDHISSSGSDHSYINQDVTTSSSPRFKSLIADDAIAVGTTAPAESIHTSNRARADKGFVVGDFIIEYNSETECLEFNLMEV